jgi:2-polyprenyl-3-methyl-5-hydroxy-6-metoxy-1,4-benzoquinol methylase
MTKVSFHVTSLRYSSILVLLQLRNDIAVKKDSDLSRPAYTGRVRYTVEAAQRYQQRDLKKHEAEMRLVAKAFRCVPPCRVLDVPCGGGRVGIWLAQNGYTVTVADLSEPMLNIARQNVRLESVDVEVQRQDIECLQYAAQSFDAVISFRLFHHFPNAEIRARAIAELCRVARRHVLLSYFSPWAGTSVKRQLQKKLFGRKMAKFATPLSEVKGYFQQNGFAFVRNFARAPLLHTLNLAVFERVK